MRFWTKLTSLFLILALLTGCLPAESSVSEPTTAPETTALPTEPVWTGYTGTSDGYVYYYEKGRDLEWEEDVLYLADVFLGEVFANGHPYLTDMQFRTFYALDGYDIENLVHFDKAKHTQFLQEINDLIPRIGKLKDHEIVLALQHALAALGDLHSAIYPEMEFFYPAAFTPFYTEEGVVLYATVLPSKYEKHLFSRLVAINGIPIEEVIEALRPYVSYENEYALLEHLSYILLSSEYLSVAGIAEYKEISTQFTLEAGDGTQTTVAMDAMTSNRIGMTERIGQTPYLAGFLTEQNPSVYYWWEYLEKDRILYVRFNHMQEDYNYTYINFVSQIRNYIKSGRSGQTVVMDFRANPGGYFDDTLSISLASILNMEQVSHAYVLIDGASYSGAISVPSCVCQLSEKAVLMGAPGGQPANFFASSHTYELPNSGLSFQMSDTWWKNDPEDQDPALMPDIVVYQTLEDFIRSRDTVMHILQSGKRPKP